MVSEYPRMRLAEALRPVSRPERIEAGRLYPLLGAHWYSRGLYTKVVKRGSEIRADTLYTVREGDFVYNRLFAWMGSFALASHADDKCYASNEFRCFEVDRSRLEPKFLFYYFARRAAWQEALGLSSGSTPTSRNRLKDEQFLGMSIPCPPLREQVATVKRLEAIRDRIELARKERAVGKRAVAALEIAAIGGVLSDMSAGGQLGDVLTEKPKNGWSARCDNSEGGTPVLSLAAVTGFRYKNTEFKRTSEPTRRGAHYWLQPGDLLITRSNTADLVGHAAVYDGFPSPCIYPDLMMRLSVDLARAEVRFVHWWLRSTPVRDYMRRIGRGTSPTMKKIDQGDVMRIPFPNGLSLDGQRSAVKRLDEAAALLVGIKKMQESTMNELDALTAAVLDSAFERPERRVRPNNQHRGE